MEGPFQMFINGVRTQKKSVIQQIYNYMCTGQLQYGVISTYDNHWFLRRPNDDPSKLLASRTLPYNHQSPTVLRSYAYIAMQARASPPSPHPNIIQVPVISGKKRHNATNTTGPNRRVIRSRVKKRERRLSQSAKSPKLCKL